MRKLIVSEFVSLDGVIEAPGGEEGFKHTGWVLDFHDSDLLAYKLEEVLAADALLLGRVTYEGFAEAWPSSDMAGFADKMNSMPKHVASTTLNARVEQLEVDRGRCRRWSRSAQAEDGGDLLVAGSRTLVHTLIEYNLVDEYRLMIFPVVLGSGGRLFPARQEKVVLRLVDTKAFDSGVVVQTYHPA